MDDNTHETALILRMLRAGWPIGAVCAELGLSYRQYEFELKLALDDEGDASRRGLRICGDVPKPTGN